MQRQNNAEKYLMQDMDKIESIYEQTLASLADRYGKRIAYYQSIPTITNLSRTLAAGATQSTANCPIYEDGMAQ